jgi:hypothetical protein
MKVCGGAYTDSPNSWRERFEGILPAGNVGWGGLSDDG